MSLNLAIGQAHVTAVTGDSGRHRKRPAVGQQVSQQVVPPPPIPAPSWGPPPAPPPVWGPPSSGAQAWGPPPPPYGAQPWGPPQPYGFQPLRSPYSVPQRSSVGHRLTIGALCIVLVAVIGGIVAAANSGSPAPRSSANPLGVATYTQPHVPSSAAPTGPAAVAVTPSSPLGPGSGEQVFSDDFQQASSGWLVGDHAGATYSYGPDGYSISDQGESHWFSLAPNLVPTQQLIMSLTAHESTHAAATSGFGLSCDTGGGADRIGYEFLVNETGNWFLERRHGQLSATSSPVLVTRGASPRPLGSGPLTISAACANLPGNFTRLVFYIDGAKVADMTDGTAAPRTGWLGGFFSSGDSSRSSTTTATLFTERAFAAGVGEDPPTGPGPSTPAEPSTPPDPYGPPVSNA
jgi:hypothetical protein